MNIKIAFTAMAVAALVASPALAQQQQQRTSRAQPAATTTYPNPVIVDGQVVGADPDIFIRGQLLREYMLQGPEW
jgi:hypothetical protein